MTNLRKNGLFLIVFVFAGIFPFCASANTISNTYYNAFSDPHRFESWLENEIAKSNSAYYGQFASCAQFGSSALDALKRQVELDYQSCRTNSECHEAAKDVSLVRELKHNFNNLVKYISAVQDGNHVNFLESEIGEVAEYVYKLGINLDRNPAFQRQLRILSDIPCR